MLDLILNVRLASSRRQLVNSFATVHIRFPKIQSYTPGLRDIAAEQVMDSILETPGGDKEPPRLHHVVGSPRMNGADEKTSVGGKKVPQSVQNHVGPSLDPYPRGQGRV